MFDGLLRLAMLKYPEVHLQADDDMELVTEVERLGHATGALFITGQNELAGQYMHCRVGGRLRRILWP